MPILYQHDFTGTAGTGVASLAQTTGSAALATVVGGGQVTQGTTAYATSASASSSCGESIGSANYVVQATVVWRGSVANGRVSLSARQVDINNRYVIRIAEADIRLIKIVSGTVTTLATHTRSLSVSQSETCELTMQGDQLAVWANGVRVIGPITDTSFTTESGKLIEWIGDAGATSTTGMHLDQYILTTDFPSSSFIIPAFGRFGVRGPVR